MASVFAGIKQIDPVEGLVQYVLDIKPYHTKIIEVLVEYLHTDPLNVTILDELDWDIFLAEPARLQAEGCCDGYSVVNFGNPVVYPIASPNPLISSEAYPAINPINDSITMLTCGDPKVFTPGTQFRFFAFLEDYSNIHALINPSLALPADYDYTTPNCSVSTVTPYTYDYTITNCASGTSHDRVYDYIITSADQSVINTVNVSTTTRTTTNTFFDIFVNGLLQSEGTDYTVTGINQVTFLQSFQVGDVLVAIQNHFALYDYLTATIGQNIVNTINVTTQAFTNNLQYFSTYINGILQRENIDYTVTGANQITFAVPLVGGEELTFIESKSLGADNFIENLNPIFGQTIINTVLFPTVSRSPSIIYFDVYVNGLLQQEFVDYTVTGTNQVTFTSPFQGIEEIFFILLNYPDDNNVYDYVTSIAAQTVFNTVNVPTIARTVSSVFFDVYVNGLLKQEGIEYTVTGLNQITFTTPLVLGDRVTFIRLFNNFYDYETADVGQTVFNPVVGNNPYDYITAIAAQTIVNTTNVTTTTRTPVDTFFDVYVNGLLKQEGIEYTVTGLNQITFTTPLVLGDRLEFIQLLNNVYDYVTSIAAQTVFSTVNVTTVARNSYVSFFDVYVNGLLKQEGIEYTVTGLNQITFTTPLVLGDSVIFVSNNLSASNTYDYITGSGGQTIVNTTNVITTAKTVTLTFFEVFLNGILQLETDSYTVTGANQFTFLAALVGGDEIIINQITTPTILIPTIARTTNTFYFDVYVNGLLKQEGIEYTVTGLNQITFTSPLTGGDFVIFVANNTFVKNGYDYITGSGGQTIVNTTNVSTIPRSATMTFFEVFLNGILQLETDSYTVTGANQFTFLAALVGGDEIIINQIVMSSAPGCSQIVVSSVSTTARTATNAFVEVFLNGLLLTEGPEYIVTSTNTINVIPTLVLGDTFTFITALNGPYDYYTATGGETIVSTTNVSTITRTATQTTFDVYVGGILQREGVDYTVTGANQVTFTIPLVLNDLVIFISTTSGVILLYDYITAVAAQTTVNTTTVTTTPRTLINAFFDVYLNGILQDEGIDYTVTGLNQITFLLSLNFGDAVTFTSILTPSACQTDVDTVNVTTTARGISMVFFDAFRNGLLQREITDYTATGINEVTFTTTLSPGEDINFLERLDTQYEYFVSGVAQTIFNTAISTQAQTATTIFTTIYVDGNLQDESTDYTVTGANQVTFISPLSGGEKVTIHFNSIGILYDTFISGLAQTTFTTTNNINLTVRTASKIFFSVYVNGLYQEEGTDYNITMPDTIVFAVPLLVGYVVHVFANSNPIILFSPLNNFFVLGDQTTQFVPFYTFQVITPSGDSGTYTVTGAGSTFMFGITIIPVFQTIQHFSGIIGVEVTPGLQMIEGIGGTNLYTVKSCVFDNGRIPARSNPLDPFSLDQGINSHAIITTIEGILSPIPPLGPNQFYIMWITLVPFNIEEVIPYSNIFPQPANTPDESAFLDIGSNMFVIDGNRAATFHQGVQFDVINGDNAGAYTTLYSDFVFVTGKTRIRTLEGIAFTGIVPGQITLSRPGYSQHETSAQTTIIGFQLFSAMDIGAGVGQTIFNLTSLSVPGSDPALIRVTINGVPAAFTLNTAIQFTITSPFVRVNDLISATVYELPQPGASAFCGSIPPHELRVKFAEKLVFIGVGVATFFDDLIVYNLENTDLYSYELPTTTIFSATMPPVPMLPNDGDITPQPNPPFGGVLFDLWFDTTTNTFRQLQSTNTALTGQRWRGIITAYWFDTANNKFFKRTKNQFTDTGWFEDVFGGYNQVFPAVGETTVIDTQLFSTGPSAQTTFTLTTPVPGSDPSLLGVTIDDVPAGFTLNTATQFTITSPTPGINQIVVATVKDRILTERNAFVGTYNPIPHRIAHTSDFVAVDFANNAYILK
ncbi:MAG: hypothetical protein ACREAU_00200, partial [Nitrosopumilaceae archaeon]